MGKRITITIETDGAAFHDDHPGTQAEGLEVARILRDLARTCEDGVGRFRLRLLDVNGNTCGFVDVTEGGGR